MVIKGDELVMAVARGIVASDFINQRLGELTEDRWQEMLKHWRELETEPAIRSGHRVEDAMRRARAALRAIDTSGTHWIAPVAATPKMLDHMAARSRDDHKWNWARDACLAERRGEG